MPHIARFSLVALGLLVMRSQKKHQNGKHHKCWRGRSITITIYKFSGSLYLVMLHPNLTTEGQFVTWSEDAEIKIPDFFLASIDSLYQYAKSRGSGRRQFIDKSEEGFAFANGGLCGELRTCHANAKHLLSSFLVLKIRANILPTFTSRLIILGSPKKERMKRKVMIHCNDG